MALFGLPNLLLFMLMAVAAFGVISGPAQAPGMLPVVCSDAHDYTSDLTVKGQVISICDSYASGSPIPAHSAAILDTYIIGGTLQYRIDNTCDTDFQVTANACELEFNSIAYGCTDNGHFYNGTSTYGW